MTGLPASERKQLSVDKTKAQSVMESAEFKALDTKIGDLRGDVGDIKKDLRGLTQALRDLIRLDGDIKSLRETVARIGKQIDDNELRMRALEQTSIENATRLTSSAKRAILIWSMVSAIASGIVVAAFASGIA